MQKEFWWEDIFESSHLEHEEGDELYGWEVAELALDHVQCSARTGLFPMN
jgi:hypothetical protein